MRNLIFLALFLVLVSGLIFWLWSDRSEEKTLQQAILTQQSEVPQIKGVPVIDLDEVDIDYGDKGLTINTLYNQDVNLTLTENLVRNVEIYQGIMTYQEKTNGQWNFRSYNLGQYIEDNLKK